MSSLTDFVGGGIKSIQRGTIVIAAGVSSSQTATVTAVNVNKSMLNYLGVTGYYSAANIDGIGNVRISLTNSTTVTANAIAIPNVTAYTVSYELIEFY